MGVGVGVLFYRDFIFMYVSVHMNVYLCTTCVPCLRSPEEIVRFPGAGVNRCWCQESNLWSSPRTASALNH